MKEPSTRQERNSNPTPTAYEESMERLSVFKAQAPHDAMDDVFTCIGQRATCARELQGSAADAASGAMVIDALGNSFVSIVAWAPLRYPLVLHHKSVIRSRLSLASRVRDLLRDPTQLNDSSGPCRPPDVELV